MSPLTIGKAAQEAGVNVETVRFYERRGLIQRPPKGAGYRLYAPEQVARIRFIKEAQQIGFSLNEISELLALRADPAADCSIVRRQAIAKRDEVQRKIAQLQAVGAALETLIAACPGKGALRACSILDALNQRSRQSAGGRTNPRPPRARHATAQKDKPMKTAEFRISGMHCGGCASTIKAVVERQPGVQAADVSYDQGHARILYDPQSIAEDRLAAAIEKIGYRVTARSG
jgi:DNA-binding transcriptional MerR regulator/copper chaperone CopZ